MSPVQYLAPFVDSMLFQWHLIVSILAVCVVTLPKYSNRLPPYSPGLMGWGSGPVSLWKLCDLVPYCQTSLLWPDAFWFWVVLACRLIEHPVWSCVGDPWKCMVMGLKVNSRVLRQVVYAHCLMALVNVTKGEILLWHGCIGWGPGGAECIYSRSRWMWGRYCQGWGSRWYFDHVDVSCWVSFACSNG